jgi:hypothetical protein
MIRKNWFVICVALFACLLAASAQAGLTYQLEIDPTSPGYMDATNAQVLAAGDLVKINVYGVVTTTDGTLGDAATSGVKVANIEFLKSVTGLKGNLSAALAQSFKGTASNPGVIADLNGDGSMDIGTSSLAAATVGSFAAVSTAGTDPIFGNKLLLGTLTFTASELGENTTIYSLPRGATTGTTAAKNALNQWRLNGTAASAGAATGADFEHLTWTNPVVSGSSVTIHGVPEPSTIVLLGLGALALVFVRRRK